MLTIQMVIADMAVETAVVTDEEAQLVRKAQENLSAFSELYQRHVQRIYRYVLMRTGNPHEAQDLTSQTFLAAMESLEKYRYTQPFAAWLIGIARHKVGDFYRQKQPQTWLTLANDLPSEEAPEEQVSQQMKIALVARKLQTLAPDRAEALSLRLFGGLEVAEIARLMGKQETAVRMLVFRGLRDLQEQLQSIRED